MTAHFRLPTGRSYDVRTSELARDGQHAEVVCNVHLLDNTVHVFRVNVSTAGVATIWPFWGAMLHLILRSHGHLQRPGTGDRMFSVMRQTPKKI